MQRRLLCRAVLGLVMCLAGPGYAEGEPARATFDKALLALQNGDPTGWLGLVRAIQQDPANADYRRSLQVCLRCLPCQPPLLEFRLSSAGGSVAFSPDGTRLVTASQSQATIVELTSDPKPIVLWDDAHRQADAAADHYHAIFSPDGQRVLTFGGTTARVWDAAAGQPITPPMIHDGISCADFSPDGARLVTGSLDKSVRAWDSHSGQALGPAVKHDAPVNFVGDTLGGRRLVTASKDGVVHVSDALTGKQISSLAMPGFDEMALSPGGRIVTRCVVGFVRVWDVSGAEVSSFDAGSVSLARLTPDGRSVVTVSAERIQCWDADTGRTQTAPINIKGAYKACLTPDGRWVAVATAAGAVRVCPLPPWRAPDRWSGSTDGTVPRAWDDITSLELQRDGLRLLAASQNGTARVLETSTGREVLSLRHADPVVVASFSPNQQSILTTSTDGTARLWDAETGRSRAAQSPMQHQGDVFSVSFSPNGRLVLTGSTSEDGNPPYTARIWNADTAKPVTPPLQGGAMAIFSPDGTRVATGGDGGSQGMGSSFGSPCHPPFASQGGGFEPGLQC